MEKLLAKKSLAWIRANLPGVFCWKVHDTFHAGIPDIIGCYGGVFFGVELKVKGGRVEKIQSFVIEQIKGAGGVAGVAWDLDQVKAIMAEVVKKGGKDGSRG